MPDQLADWLLVASSLGFLVAVLWFFGSSPSTRSGHRRQNAAAHKGAAGEAAVKRITMSNLPSPLYRQYHDVTLPTANGGTTQIDHLIVSPFGVFVVETKTMSGLILGRAGDRMWTQALPSGQRHTFYNPIRQNQGHVRALKRLCLAKVRYHPVTVFLGNSKFAYSMPDNVLKGGYTLYDYIISFNRRVVPDSQVERFCAVIERRRLPATKGTSRLHVRNVRRAGKSS